MWFWEPNHRGMEQWQKALARGGVTLSWEQHKLALSGRYEEAADTKERAAVVREATEMLTSAQKAAMLGQLLPVRGLHAHDWLAGCTCMD